MIPVFHNLSAAKAFYSVSPSAFEGYLLLLSRHFTFVTLEEYVQNIRKTGDSGNTATLTFDDAFVSFQEHALPLLEKLKIPASVFVSTGLAGGTNEWDRHLTKEVIHILDTASLRSLAAHPLVTLGTHGITHISFGRLAPDAVREKLIRSKQQLEEITGREIKYFCYPYGQIMDMPRGTDKIIRECGYEAALSTRTASRNRVEDMYALRRVSIEPQDTEESVLARALHGKGRMKQGIKELLWKMHLRGKPGGIQKA